jgi:hypothetical protein
MNRGHLWRPFISNGPRGHWSVFAPFEGHNLFEPGARATRGSLLLGKGQGHLMPAVAASVSRRGRAFSGAAAERVVGGVGRQM